MKKEGIMRINSYNKFFAKVAEIMNTEVKAVKQLDGRYKVELANHVYLNVYRGVIGALFVHDHRGLAFITSCYEFEDFKTMKDLYERLIIDYGEITDTTTEKHYDDYTAVDFVKSGIAKECTDCPDFCEEGCIENAECAKGNDVFEGCKTVKKELKEISKTPSILDVMQCTMCKADRQGNRCSGEQFCKQTWKRYNAIVNPEWHHVSIATLANIDFDMLDEKRKLVCDINQILKDGIRNLYKCENHISFEVLERYVIRKCDELIRRNRLKAFWFSYIARQLDEVRRNTIYLYTPYITAHRK